VGFYPTDLDAIDRAIEMLKALYPSAPKEPPEGAKSEYSTYLHLII
jgi:hypothetical protein